MLDEQALRRPDFVGGTELLMDDGQKWSIAKPVLKFRPKPINGKITLGGGPTFGPEFDELMDIILGVTEVEDGETLRARFEMTVRLLQRNYDLTDEQACSLISFEPNSDEGRARWSAITDALIGIVPKEPTPATSDSPVESPA